MVTYGTSNFDEQAMQSKFEIGCYHDEVLCDIISIDSFHVYWVDHGNFLRKKFMMGRKI